MVTRRQLMLRGKAKIPEENAAFESRELLLHLLSISKEAYFLDPDAPVSSAQAEAFDALVARRAQGEPLAYLIGEWDFYGRPFHVSPGVLIPRPETEEVVAAALDLMQPGDRVLDLCCGSGCIGITMALEGNPREVVLGDISPMALEVTRKNADRYPGLPLTIRVDDALGKSEETYDLIVSNPPYIAPGEELDHSVKGYEPHLALYGGPDGLDFYRAIAKYRLPGLSPKGHLVLECGHTQAPEIAKILTDAGAREARILTDLSGKERIIVASPAFS